MHQPPIHKLEHHIQHPIHLIGRKTIVRTNNSYHADGYPNPNKSAVPA